MGVSVSRVQSPDGLEEEARLQSQFWPRRDGVLCQMATTGRVCFCQGCECP